MIRRAGEESRGTPGGPPGPRSEAAAPLTPHTSTPPSSTPSQLAGRAYTPALDSAPFPAGRPAQTGYSLQVDNIIASAAMEGITLDQDTIDDLVKIERGELDADDAVAECIARLRR